MDLVFLNFNGSRYSAASLLTVVVNRFEKLR